MKSDPTGLPPILSVVIPHQRGRELLLGLLSDLQREREALDSFEVVLVDNGSIDGSTEAAKKTCPWINVLRLPHNEGFAGGCNQGIVATDSQWVLLLNDDVRLEQGMLKELLRVAESSPEIAAVQPKILSLHDERRFDYAGGAGGLIDRFGYPFALGRIGGVMEEDRGQYNESREIFWASGTACLWRREALEKVGLLDETFFAHMEEIDLAWRAWNSGWKIYSAPSAVVKHLGGGTLSYRAWRKMYLNHRNSLIAIAKNRESSALMWLIPSRLFLDIGIGLAELFSGRPGRISAVLAGWIAFIWSMPKWLKQRRAINPLRARRDCDLSTVVYDGCILIAYARGVRSAAELIGRSSQ